MKFGKLVIISIPILCLAFGCSNNAVTPTYVTLSPATALPSTATTTPYPTATSEAIPEPTATSDPLSFVSHITPSGDMCIASFHSFAYTVPERGAEIRQIIPPLPPWEFIAGLPAPDYGNFRFGTILAIRSVEGTQEIWILSTEQIGSLVEYYREILIYYPESGEWESVSPYIDGTELFVGELFFTGDGNIWGLIDWYPSTRQEFGSFSLLVKYNFENKAFESIPEIADSPIVVPHSSSDIGPVLLDEENTFWIFQANDGLYSFDPETLETAREIAFPGEVLYAAFGNNGSIYFTLREHEVGFNPGELFQYFPGTGELVSLDPPEDEQWPSFAGLLVDQQDRLWLGSVGWLGQDSTWNLMHPDYEGWLQVMPDARWATPKVIAESSNGVMWFSKYTETMYAGMVWYDPQSEGGCWFTNQVGSIVEDSDQAMWLLVTDKLYRYSLSASTE